MKKFWKPALSMILVLGCTVSIASATVTPVQSDDLLQPYGAATQFQDVPSNAWFYNDISKAVDMGWMKGTSATTFKPNDKLTNAQILQIISILLLNTARILWNIGISIKAVRSFSLMNQ